ncbi:MAG: DEAD/DEAH box helicase [Muribaculaceae bacterium]
MGSYYYEKLPDRAKSDFLKSVEEFSERRKIQVYVLSGLLSQKEDEKINHNSYIVLTPKRKILFVNQNQSKQDFEEFMEDVKDDVAYISKKYDAEKTIGRRRSWNDCFVDCEEKGSNFEKLYSQMLLIDDSKFRLVDIIISLFIGSINDASKLLLQEPDSLLDKIKYKIQLFDTDQTRFIYEDLEQQVIRIQGLAGTGKTELLLHKLKEIYINDKNSRIALTCHNKVLANSLSERVPKFFNAMKVETQIEWNERVWCFNAWGRANTENSGLLKLICSYYDIPFISYQSAQTFDNACKYVMKMLKENNSIKNYGFVLDYIFIDESQDFEDSFIDLCTIVAKKKVFVAGDVFQSIFEERPVDKLHTDYLLSKCYRTDPKTLMFAQGLGMGLFEEKKLYWLDKEKWEICGYSVQEDIKHNTYTLTREPIRRFEDLSPDYPSIVIDETQDFTKAIIQHIKNLKIDYPSITAKDVCIILLDNENYIYEFAPRLGDSIFQETGWNFVLAHETKYVGGDCFVITNRNNVKGLEFPFVFCVTNQITRDHNYRNAIYTMLSRSFLRSYLIIRKSETNGLTEEMRRGVEHIMNEKNIIVKIPSPEEIREIKHDFEINKNCRSLRERAEKMMKEKLIPEIFFERIIKSLNELNVNNPSDDKLEAFINNTFSLLSHE